MHQFSQGKSTTQGHKGIPEGHFEEEQGRKGFYGPVSHLIKPNPSTRWTSIDGPLRPHLFDPVEMKKNHGIWQRMLFNSDAVLYNFWLNPQAPENAQAHRNGDGDTLFFVHKGMGEIFTEYGLLKYTPGSYVNIPKCVTYSIFPLEESN